MPTERAYLPRYFVSVKGSLVMIPDNAIGVTVTVDREAIIVAWLEPVE